MPSWIGKFHIMNKIVDVVIFRFYIFGTGLIVPSLLAFAQVSRMYDYVLPEVVEENMLDIREGR